MKIYFLRHTTLNIADEIFYGQSDVDVSKNFLNEVKLIKSKILSEEIDLEKIKIISSPLKRCKKLAMQIRPKFIVDSRLKELDLGDWEMKPMNSIPKKIIKDWEENIMTFKIPNGESNKTFLKRLDSFLKDILSFNQDVLLVAHAGSINGMISILTDQPFDKLVKNYWEKISHGSLTSIFVEENNIKLNYIGK